MNPDNLGPEGVSVVNPIVARTAQSKPYSRIESAPADVLLVQADASDAAVDLAIERSDRLGGGVVLTGEKALQAAEHLVRSQRYQRPILVDRSRYTGKNRASASDHLDLSWIERQRRLELPVVIPDAGYVGEHDDAGLDSVLQRCAALGGR